MKFFFSLIVLILFHVSLCFVMFYAFKIELRKNMVQNTIDYTAIAKNEKKNFFLIMYILYDYFDNT